MLIAEIGVEMERFGSAERLASWAGICPGNHESAGKRKTTRIRQGNRVLRQLLCEVANAACKTHSQFRSKYQALVIRGGKSAVSSQSGTSSCAWSIPSSRSSNPTAIRDEYEALVVAKNAPRWLKALKKYGYLTEARQDSVAGH